MAHSFRSSGQPDWEIILMSHAKPVTKLGSERMMCECWGRRDRGGGETGRTGPRFCRFAAPGRIILCRLKKQTACTSCHSVPKENKCRMKKRLTGSAAVFWCLTAGEKKHKITQQLVRQCWIILALIPMNMPHKWKSASSSLWTQEGLSI